MKKSVITGLLLASVVLGGCSGQQKPAQQPVQTRPIMQTSPIETTVPADVPETIPYAGVPLQTPCGVLYIPDDWDLPITTETVLGDPMVITFWAGDVRLYDLTFSESAGTCIGMAQAEDGPVYVGMVLHALPEETDMLMSMQESVNMLLEQLQLSEAEQPLPETADDILIETQIGTLTFPGKWKEHLTTVPVDDDAVEFYCCLPEREPVLVFTVLLRSGDGDLISSITDKDGVRHTLSIWIARLEFDESWSEAEADTVYAMQEDMNDLLEALEP